MQKKYRLHGKKTFDYILKRGTSIRTKAFVLIYAQSKYSKRVGFIVSKKIGNAVTRNKTRRRLKESFRLSIQNIKDNFNYIVIARPGIEKMSYNEINNILISTLKKAGLYQED